jgi:hypothetical protein
MRNFRRLAVFTTLLVFTALLSSSCMGGSYTTSNNCRGGGGWYSKDKNLGPKNKPLNHNKSYRLVRN